MEIWKTIQYLNQIRKTLCRKESIADQWQEVEIISDGVAYRSILTGRERGKNTKLVFGTVRLDLTKILRRSGNGQ